MKINSQVSTLKKYWLFFGLSILLGLLLAVGSFELGQMLRPKVRLYGAELDPPVPAVGFSFQGSHGELLELRNFRGQLVLLYFGYTHCVTDCPVILKRLADARKSLGTQAEQVAVVFITLDPLNDTPGVLQDYLASFGPGFYGAAGTIQETHDLALSNDLDFAANTDGEIAHTPLVLLIDRAGFKRAVYPAGLSAEQISADLKTLLSEPPGTTNP